MGVFEQTTGIVNTGISQTFDYGIGMTIETLFLGCSLAVNVVLLRFFMRFVKDGISTQSGTLEVLGEIKKMIKP